MKKGVISSDVNEIPSTAKWSPCWPSTEKADISACSFNGANNVCFNSSTVFLYLASTQKVCAFERECVEGKVINEDCNCEPTPESCEIVPECQLPLSINLPESTCPEERRPMLPDHLCSVIHPGPNCDRAGFDVTLPFVIDSTKKYRPVAGLNILWKPVVSREMAIVRAADRSGMFDSNGDKEYCKVLGSDVCYRPESGNRPYRSVLRSATIPYQVQGNCSYPVYCYGSKTFRVFQHKISQHTETCKDCKATCEKDNLHMILAMHGLKDIKICGKYNCKVINTTDMVHEWKRDFHSKVNDDRLHIVAHTEDRSHSWEAYADCPVQDVCSALDCYFCADYVLNPSCYNYLTWWILAMMVWMLIVALGMMVMSIKPLFLLGRMVVRGCFFSLRWLLLVVIFIYSFCAGKVREGKRQVDEAVLKSVEVTPTRTAKFRESPNVSPARGPIRMNDERFLRLLGRRKQLLSAPEEGRGLILLMLVLNLLGSSKAVAPCSSSDMLAVPSEMCELAGGKAACSVSTNLHIKLYSYDQTSCGYLLGPEGSILGQIQVTPLSISMRCEKESLYFSREVKLSFDTTYYCPGSHDCDDKWCKNFDNKTSVEGWGAVIGPVRAFCKFGESCASHGCFFCTRPTCHPFRYYPAVQNKLTYEMFRCAKWTPVAKVSVFYKSEDGEAMTTVELIHGQKQAISSGLEVELELSLNEHLPILSRDFVTDGHRLASTQVSPPGSPVAGQIGQLQCASREEAEDMGRCQMAPNACVCGIEFDGGSCDCSNVFIEPLFSGPERLPIKIDNYHIETERGRVYLKTPAYGSGRILARVKGRVVGFTETAHKCHLGVSKVSGCYSCLRGASLSYKCVSTDSFSTIMNCGAFKTVILCDPSASVKEVAVRVETLAGDFKCKVPCSSNEESVSGVFTHISHPELNDASHIQLIPPPAEGYTPTWLPGWSTLFTTKFISVAASLVIAGFVTTMVLKIIWLAAMKKIA